MSHPIFISYAREDSAFALRLATDLRAEGLAVWIDQQNIRPGEPWDGAIETALTASDTQLLILSPDAIASQTVMNELAFALDEGKRVVPVLHRQCRIPLRIKRLHYVDLTHDYETRATELAASLKSGAPFTHFPPPEPAPKPRPRLRSALMAAAIGAILGALSILLAADSSMSGELPTALVIFAIFGAFIWAPAGALVACDKRREIWSAAAAFAAIVITFLVAAKTERALLAFLFTGPGAALAGAWLARFSEK